MKKAFLIGFLILCIFLCHAFAQTARYAGVTSWSPKYAQAVRKICDRLRIEYSMQANGWIRVTATEDQVRRIKAELKRSVTLQRPTPRGGQQQSKQGKTNAEEIRDKIRKAFERERDEMYGQLKGIKSIPLGLKGVRGSIGKRRDSIWWQLNCASYLARKAAEASLSGDPCEASFLSIQADQAMVGGPLAVECPEVSPPLGLQPRAPKTVDAQVRLYKILLKSTKEQTKRLEKIEERIKSILTEKEKAEGEVSEREKTLDELKLKPVDPGKDEEIEKATSLLERAIKELAESEAALAEVTKERQGVEKNLDQYRAIFSDLEKNPGHASEYLEAFEKNVHSTKKEVQDENSALKK